MKILVTGANGYLGNGIIKELLDNKIEVVASDICTNNVDDRAIKIDCNLFDIDDPFNYFEKPDILLHLAWRDGFKHYSDAHITDLPKHYKFIKKIAESGCKQIAVMGTMHEIGFYEGSIDENTPCNPTIPYGISKNALRQLTELICKNNNILFQWLRGYYIVGNSKYGSSIFSKITKAVEDGQKEFPFTMGQNQYDFIDYPDFCKQVTAAIKQTKEKGIINICSGKPEKLADRVESFIHQNKFDIKLKYGEFPDRPYDSKAIWGDSRIIEKILKQDIEKNQVSK